MDKKLTVVIPVYNRGDIVGRTLKSVEAQTLRPLRTVLVDNGSTDNSLDVLRQWRDRTSGSDFEIDIVSEPHGKAAGARNAGLAITDTPWVMFFDSDDTMHPTHCSRAMNAVTSDTDVLGWNVNMHLPDGLRTGRFVGPNPHFDNIFHGGFATQRWIARTDVVRKAGGWSPDALIWNDIELGARIIESGARIRRLSGHPTVDVYHSCQSISTEPWLSRLSRMETTLRLIENTLPARYRHYTCYKAILAAGEAMRTSHDDAVRAKAARMYSEAIAKARSGGSRLLMNTTYNYIRHLERGSVTLLSFFIK